MTKFIYPILNSCMYVCVCVWTLSFPYQHNLITYVMSSPIFDSIPLPTYADDVIVAIIVTIMQRWPCGIWGSNAAWYMPGFSSRFVANMWGEIAFFAYNCLLKTLVVPDLLIYLSYTCFCTASGASSNHSWDSLSLSASLSYWVLWYEDDVLSENDQIVQYMNCAITLPSLTFDNRSLRLR